MTNVECNHNYTVKFVTQLLYPGTIRSRQSGRSVTFQHVLSHLCSVFLEVGMNDEIPRRTATN